MEHRHSHPHTLPHRIDLIVYPGFKSLEAIGPMSVFDYANIHLRARGQRDGYEVRITSAAQGVVQSDTLMALQATQSLGELAERGTGCTVIVVPHRDSAGLIG